MKKLLFLILFLPLLAFGQVDDSNTKLLIHCDSDSPFIDESGKTVTPHGTVSASTTQKKFGAASALFNGSTDYLTLANSSDFDLTVSGDSMFTIDFQIYPTSFTGYCGIIGTATGSPVFTEGWTIYTHTDGVVRVSVNGAASDVVTSGNQSLTLNQWNHVALVRTGLTNLNIAINGTFGNAPKSGSFALTYPGGGIVIGRLRISDNANYFSGYIDEPRKSSNKVRWTTDFTPPSCPYFIGCPSTTALPASGGVSQTGSYQEY